MLAPVRIAAPAETPVSLAEAKVHCRVDHDDENALIAALVDAAAGHLDGWTGVLGRALVTQTWRQDFSCLDPCGLRLALAPVASIVSVTYVDSTGATQDLGSDNWQTLVDARGPVIVPATGIVWPGTARRPDAVSVTYIAGAAADDVPAPIKAAMLLLIGHWYANREAVNIGNIPSTLPMAVDALLAPYRRVGV